jgi:hypothetical protein
VSDSAPSVTLAEALPLVAAFAARVAEDANLRLLLIKGRPAADLGVRTDRPSIDVDVWVDPTCESEYLVLLADHGWEKLPGPPAGVGWGHAITLRHPDWPATIDVHHAFPGFLADDATVFEEVWQRRQMVIVADRTLATPDRVAAAAITILHALRSTVITETNEDHDRALATAAGFSDDERRSLQHLAERTGSAGTLDALSGTSAPISRGKRSRDGCSPSVERPGHAGSDSSWLHYVRPTATARTPRRPAPHRLARSVPRRTGTDVP